MGAADIRRAAEPEGAADRGLVAADWLVLLPAPTAVVGLPNRDDDDDALFGKLLFLLLLLLLLLGFVDRKVDDDDDDEGKQESANIGFSFG